MTIYIGHLYYDLMNLYGEIGNIKALKYSLENAGVKVVIDKLSINDNIDFSKYDILYIGSGTENNERVVLNDIKKYKNELKKYIEDNKFVIATGNSIELFGKTIFNKKEYKALNIFDYSSKLIDKRIVGDIIIPMKNVNKDIIGFQNRGSIIENNNYPLFDNDYTLGINYKNFYGTYILGPILIRNPELNKYLINKLLKSKNKKFKPKNIDLNLDKKAYTSYLKTYHEE